MHNWIWKSQPCWGPSILTGRNALTSAADAFFLAFWFSASILHLFESFSLLRKRQKAICMHEKSQSAKSSSTTHTHTRHTYTNGKQKIRCASNGWLLNRNATHESNKHTQVSFALLFAGSIVGFGYMCALSVGNKYNDIKLGYISHSLPFECSGAVCARHMHIPATFRE